MDDEEEDQTESDELEEKDWAVSNLDADFMAAYADGWGDGYGYDWQVPNDDGIWVS